MSWRRGGGRSPRPSPREYVADALDLHICAACRQATVGPPTCDHSAPIVVASRSDVASWWRVRLLGRTQAQVADILHVSGARMRLAVARGRSTPGRLGVRWVTVRLDG